MASLAATAAALPPDVRLMQATAGALAVLAALALGASALGWAARLPVFTLRAVKIEGDVSRNSESTIRANAAPRLAGNFLTLDLQQARAAFEAVPWVRQAVVRRVWPMRLAVHLEEHRPLAYWGADDEGGDRLVNSHGEVFEANLGDLGDERLPRLVGPEGSSAQLLAMLQKLAPVLEPLEAGAIERLVLSARGSWRVELDKGVVLELGRGSDDEVLARSAHFVRTMPRVQAAYQRPLESADLRHADGFAVRLKGITTIAAAAPARRK
jgi:cell division protein FtsQ